MTYEYPVGFTLGNLITAAGTQKLKLKCDHAEFLHAKRRSGHNVPAPSSFLRPGKSAFYPSPFAAEISSSDRLI